MKTIWSYRAVIDGGRTISGEVEAPDRRSAVRILRSRGCQPVAVDKSGTSSSSGRLPFQKPTPGGARKMKPLQAGTTESARHLGGSKGGNRQALLFLRKLNRLHASGMPIGDAVRLMTVRLQDPQLLNLARDIWRDLSEGHTLAAALRRHPKVFPETLTYVIEAGEATGNLSPVLENLITHLQRNEDLRKRILASLAYPCFISLVAFAVVILFLFYLLPRIQMMLESLGGEMSLPARILVGGAHAILAYGPAAVIVILVLVVATIQWRKRPAGRRTSDVWFLNIPVVGRLLYLADINRISQLGSALLGSGVNTTEALRLLERAVANTVLRENFHDARQRIHDGTPFTVAMGDAGIFPAEAIDILGIGESTGDIASSLEELARQFGDDLTDRLQRMTTVIASSALLAAFLLVAFLTLGIVYSILQVSQNLVA